ncbi:MAG: ABC transporter substrate-binding protein [Actinomycetota bacterium]|nr:ABC transporter substrate-binding protein [Actinomycetota bacterium]
MNLRRVKILPVVVGVVLVSAVSFGPRYITHTSTRSRVVAGEQATGGTATSTTDAAGKDAAGRTSTKAGIRGGSLGCARGRNGGATDVGVTGTSIKLGATVVRTGIGATFLGEVPVALDAVKNRVNREGGICGRLLSLQMVNDEWKADVGEGVIRKFIADGAFALAVSPSSQGLDAAIRAGDISKAGIPVVGADGMLISQYTDPWVWPVAASTITAMHVMAKDAAARGAKTFGLVYDQSYHFGVEGASAFRGALSRIFPGQDVLKADVPVEAYKSDYKNKVEEFNTGCDPCDFVAMLLEPPTALQWIRDGGSFGSMAGGTGGPQPLFVDSFARVCGTKCNGMWVWTGYSPPIAPFDDVPGVVKYTNDVKAQKSTTDVNNPFVEGGYLGMELLVQALRDVGPDLTRARLRSALDHMTLDRSLSQPLQWRSGNHFANNSVQAFSIVINAGSFSAWRWESQQTGWQSDPWPGQDAPKR